MLDPEKTEIIVAGPGVGKTTELLNRIEKALILGVPPEEIAFFSFSTTAVNEGLTRITSRLEYNKTQFPYFRTLHSMAFSMLGISPEQVISSANIRDFARTNDLKLAPFDFRSKQAQWQTPDMKMLEHLESARLLDMSVRDYWVKYHIEEPSIARAEEIDAKFKQYKLSHGIIDFTDMIMLANQINFDTPHFQYMFIDEAQDLSKQQWFLVEKLAKTTDNVVVVGDERQAIAEFAGADVNYFLKIQGTLTELNQSYRVPKKIHTLARKVEAKMSKIRGTDWKPRPKEFGEETGGEIIRTHELPIREMSRGHWLVLTRTNSQLMDMRDYMMNSSHLLPAPFTIDGKPPVDMDIFKAIKMFQINDTVNTMTKYDFVMPDDKDKNEDIKKKKSFIMTLKKYISSKNPRTAELDSVFLNRFAYKNWENAFDKLTLMEKKYVKLLLPAYNKDPLIFSKAKVKLSTIHSAKGMEADNVILCTALTPKVYKEWQDEMETNDTELKVLFVGLTRARKRLYLLSAKNDKRSYNEVLL